MTWCAMFTHWFAFDFLQTYAEMDPTTAALEKEHEAVTKNLITGSNEGF